LRYGREKYSPKVTSEPMQTAQIWEMVNSLMCLFNFLERKENIKLRVQGHCVGCEAKG
jgi:hypothetical protein